MEASTHDRKAIKAKEKADRQADRDRGEVVINLLSTGKGRAYVWEQLTAAHVFSTSFTGDAMSMAFAEGERNAGLRLLNEIIEWCPEQFIQMMRESNARRTESRSDDTGGRDDYGRPIFDDNNDRDPTGHDIYGFNGA